MDFIVLIIFQIYMFIHVDYPGWSSSKNELVFSDIWTFLVVVMFTFNC